MGKIKVVKVVIDTNVIVSGLLFGGVPGRLVELWKEDRIHPVTSPEMIDEILRVLAYPKFHLSQREIEFLVYQELLPWFEIVEVTPGSRLVADDPSDDQFLWCAEAAHADWIISGDEHLLKMRDFTIPVVTPRRFLDTLETIV